MDRKIYIKFKNGDVFELPVIVIAEMRTQYYSEVDGFEKDSDEWNSEMEQSLVEFEVYDWLTNNCNWSDIKNHVKKIDYSKPIDYQKEFIYANINFKLDEL